MPLFACESCNCIENTATSGFWANKMRKRALLCSECDPQIGKWHGVFDKITAVGMLIDNFGYLWSKRNLEGKLTELPPGYQIVGEVVAKPPSN